MRRTLGTAYAHVVVDDDDDVDGGASSLARCCAATAGEMRALAGWLTDRGVRRCVSVGCGSGAFERALERACAGRVSFEGVELDVLRGDVEKYASMRVGLREIRRVRLGETFDVAASARGVGAEETCVMYCFGKRVPYDEYARPGTHKFALVIGDALGRFSVKDDAVVERASAVTSPTAWDLHDFSCEPLGVDERPLDEGKVNSKFIAPSRTLFKCVEVMHVASTMGARGALATLFERQSVG